MKLPSNARRSWRGGVLLVMATWWASAAAWLLALTVDIETIMGSGPVLLAMAIGGMTLGRKSRSIPLAGVAGVQAAFPVAIFLLIVMMHWGPGAAQEPVLVISAVYIATMIPTILWLRRRPMLREAWKCQRCGYELIGLTEPRCPECWTGFDAAAVGVALAREGIAQPAAPV